MNKKEIIEQLKGKNEKTGCNSMGVSESFYNKFYLTNDFLEAKTIKPKSLTEKELNLLIDLAEHAGECFY